MKQERSSCMTVVQVTSRATPSLGRISRRQQGMKSVSHLPAGGVTARCGALSSLPLCSHRHPARVYRLQGPCISSLHPLSLQRRVMSDLPRKKGANSLAWAPLRPVQPRDPAEDNPELSHCSSTETLVSAATWSAPHELCLCSFLQFIV